MQIIDSIFELLGIAPDVGRLVVILLGIGFPIAAALAWAFDITEPSIVRTKRTTAPMGASQKPLTSNRALIAIAIIAIAFGVWSRWGGGGEEAESRLVAAIEQGRR